MPLKNGDSRPIGIAGLSGKPEALLPFHDWLRPVPASDSSASEFGQGKAAAPDVSSLLRAIRRRWFLALVAGLALMASAAGGAWEFLPNRVATSCVIQVAAAAPTVLGGQREDRVEFSIYQKRQQAQVKARATLVAALELLDERGIDTMRQISDPVSWLQKELKVDFQLGPENMRLSLSTDQPLDMVPVLDAVGAAYCREVVQREHAQRQKRIDQYREAKKKAEQNRDARQREIDELEKKGGGKDAGLVRVFLLQAQKKLEGELEKAKSDLRRVETTLKAKLRLKNDSNAEVRVPDDEIDKAIRLEPEYAALAQQRARMQEELVKEEGKAAKGKDQEQLKPLRDQLQANQNALERLHGDLRQRVTDQLAKRARSNLDRDITLLTDEKAQIENMKQALTEEAEINQAELAKLPGQQFDLEALRQNCAPLQRLVDQFGIEIEALGLESAVGSRVNLVESASVDWSAAINRRLKMTGLGGGLGLLLGIGLVVWIETRKQRIENVSDVVGGLGMPVVGLLPHYTQRSGVLSGAGEGKAAELTEYVDRTRTRLLHVARTDNARVLLITSAAAGEGKTMTACHLAASLARAGRRTLLVDGDLRRPVVHGVFEIPASPGLAELLRAEANVEQAVQLTSLPTFSILPAGRWDAAAAQALARDRFRDLLGLLKTRFDFIIVDSAPVLPLVDSLLLGQHCDGVIFSLLHGVSRAPAVRSAGECLAQLGIRVFGAVLNGAVIRHSGPAYAAVSD